MPMQEAIDAPKISFVEPNSIRVEQDIPEQVVKSLNKKGHHITRGNIGNATGIKILRNKGKISHFDVGIDKRGEGKAAIVDH